MMAIIPPLTTYDIHSYGMIPDSTLRAIKGAPVLVNYMVDELSAVQGAIPSDDEIKLQLCYNIAHELFLRKMIEFTKEVTPFGNIHYRARIFAVPNTDVKLLREQGIIK